MTTRSFAMRNVFLCGFLAATSAACGSQLETTPTDSTADPTTGNILTTADPDLATDNNQAPDHDLLFRGYITAPTEGLRGSAREVVTLPVLAMSPGARLETPTGNYTFELLDAERNLLRSLSFGTYDFHVDDFNQDDTWGDGPKSEWWTVLVVDPPDWASFRILEPATTGEADGSLETGPSSTVLTEVPRSANPPEVSITAPTAGQVVAGEEVTFSWIGADADGDALYYTVAYSSDGGANYEIIAVNYDSNSLTVGRVWLAGSSMSKIKVTASDGTMVTSAESAVFTVNSNPPQVFIHSPDPDFTGTGALLLDATAYDTEDHRLDDSAIQWTSDIDGYLGTGSNVWIYPEELSPGMHLLTATATDSSGVTGSAEVVWTNIIPRPPTGVSAVAGDQSITISWDEPAPYSVAVYQYRYRPASETWTDWTTVAAGATVHTITGLTNGTTYEVVLQTQTDAASSMGILITPS